MQKAEPLAEFNKDTQELIDANRGVLIALDEEIDCKLKEVQRQTAKKIIKRCVKMTKTVEEEVQTSEDETMVRLADELKYNEELVSKYKDEVVGHLA